MVGFVPEPDHGRGTIGILWSCLFTMFLCAHATFYVIPDYEQSIWLSFYDRLLFAVHVFLFPESLVCVARQERNKAIGVQRMMKDAGWNNATVSQGFLLVMGAIQVEDTYGGHICLRQNGFEDFLDNHRDEFILKFPDPKQVKAMINRDGLVKFIMLAQGSWFVTHFITRYCQSKAVSLLEITSLAFIGISLLTWAFWWQKPYIFSSPIVLPIELGISPQENNEGEDAWGAEYFDIFECGLWTISTICYIGLQCMAWNYAFPTKAELFLWRVGSIVCLASSLVVNLCIWLEPKVPSDDGTRRTAGLIASNVPILVLGVTRLLLLVEAFVALRWSPANLYASIGWLGSWPRVGA